MNKLVVLYVFLTCIGTGWLLGCTTVYDRRIVADKQSELAALQLHISDIEHRIWFIENKIDFCEFQIDQILKGNKATVLAERLEQIMHESDDYSKLLDSLYHELNEVRERAARMVIELGQTKHIGKFDQVQISDDIVRLLANDEQSLTKKFLRLVGHLPANGSFEKIIIKDCDGVAHEMVISCLKQAAVPEKIVVVHLPCLCQEAGTCGTHANYNTETLVQFFQVKNKSLNADRELIWALLSELCSTEAFLAIGQKIETLQELRRIDHSNIADGMTIDETFALLDLERKNDFIMPGCLGYDFIDDDIGYFRSQYIGRKFEEILEQILVHGYYASLRVNIGTVDKKFHAITCRIERLLDGTIGIVYANSGADMGCIVGSDQKRDFAKDRFFIDLAHACSLQP